MSRILLAVWRGVQLFLAAFLILWVTLAVHYQIENGLRFALFALIAVAAVGLAVLAYRRRWLMLWGGMGAILGIFLVWWSTLDARSDRDWKPEVAHGVTATFGDGRVTVANIRDFRWTSETEAEEHWDTRVYDPDAITSVDMILSVWSSPYIAHTLVSFGFEDGEHLVFSAEIRKEKGEEYSTLGGFFREYELVLLAADERDIVRLRTDEREEQVSLYPLIMPPETRKELLISLLEYGNELDRQPAWYNTATTNCTTVPFRLASQLAGGLPFDPAILLSGLLPGYVYRLGALPAGLSLDEVERRARLGHLGPATDDGVAFSARMRSNWTE